MKRRLAVLSSILTLAFGAGSVAATPALAAASKSCSSRYVHAVISGEHKCLHSGQFCSTSKESTYRRYGFTCKRGSDGRNRLFRR